MALRVASRPGARIASPLDSVAAPVLNPPMKAASQAPALFTASQIAAFCSVDLKTIHNWAERGELRHFRTPGRHLRFRRNDVVEFLRKYGYPVPAEFIAGVHRVYVLDEDAATLAGIKRTLGKLFEVTTFQDPVDALVTIGVEVPDAIVLDVEAPGFDGMRCVARLKQLGATQGIPIVALGAKSALAKKALEAGASAFVAKADVGKIGEVIDGLVGRKGA
jgi:excisionase family DNA binding protein